MKVLVDLVARNADRFGGRDAYIEMARRRTWRGVHTRASALARFLRKAGIRPGDRVGIVARDCIEMAETIVACSAVGAIRVGLNHRLAPMELAALIDDAGISLLFVQSDHEEHVGEALGQAASEPVLAGFGDGHGCEYDYEAVIAETLDDGPVVPTPHETLMISYTTGSTGLPKGAVYPQDAMIASMADIALCEGALPSDVWLHAMPTAGIPIMHLLRNVFHGSPCVIVGDWSAERALALIERERCSITVLVPTMLSDLLRSGLIERYDVSSMRQMGYGASNLPAATIRAAIKAFGCGFLQMYGSTELMGMATMMWQDEHRVALAGDDPAALARLESAGRPLYFVDLRIVDEGGAELPSGSDGELLVRSPYTTPAYWNAADQYAQTVRDGWLHTGDIAMRDADGFIHIKDRMKFRIKSGGYNIFPTEVENCIATHPAVAEVCVVGLPDERLGQRVHAIVALNPGATVEGAEIAAHCRGRVAGFKIPKDVEIWPVIPKGPTGKIQKRDVIRTCLDRRERGMEVGL